MRVEGARASAAALLEPEKAALRSSIRVTALDNGRSETFFVKTGNASSRGLPLWLTALSSYGGNREVLAYQRVLPLLKDVIMTPQAVLAAAAPLLARWCLILDDMTDGRGTVEYIREPQSTSGIAAHESDGSPEWAAFAHERFDQLVAEHPLLGPIQIMRLLNNEWGAQHGWIRKESYTNERPDRPAGGDGGATRRRRRSRSPASRAAAAVSTDDGQAPRLLAYVVPDRTGCSRMQALSVVRGLAKLHCTYWDRAHLEPALGFVNGPRGGKARGYVPAPAVGLLLGRALPKMPRIQKLWGVLLQRLADAPVALLHGDCRPENLLFYGSAASGRGCPEDVEGGEARWRVAFLDWEAIGVNPAANDLVYFCVVGLRAADSAQWQAELLEAYQAQLAEEAVARGGGAAGGYSLRALRDDFALVGLVLLCVQACFAVTDIFKGWGNNKKNLLPWKVRLCRFTLRLDVQRLASLLRAEAAEAGVDVVEVLESMKEKAAKGLRMLSDEHGAAEIECL